MRMRLSSPKVPMGSRHGKSPAQSALRSHAALPKCVPLVPEDRQTARWKLPSVSGNLWKTWVCLPIPGMLDISSLQRIGTGTASLDQAQGLCGPVSCLQQSPAPVISGEDAGTPAGGSYRVTCPLGKFAPTPIVQAGTGRLKPFLQLLFGL